MSRDPWAVDWEDDWTKAAKQSKPSSEIWSQANSASTLPTAELVDVAPAVAYRPQVKILKRDPASSASAESNASAQSKAPLTAAERELRYKEARERLFGSAEPSSNAASRRNSPAKESSELVTALKPERQARGPPENGSRGGFASRGRGRDHGYKAAR